MEKPSFGIGWGVKVRDVDVSTRAIDVTLNGPILTCIDGFRLIQYCFWFPFFYTSQRGYHLTSAYAINGSGNRVLK